MNKVYHRSQSDEWETPPELFELLDDEFHFTLDVCATHENAKCDRYFTAEDDGLKQNWHGEICWMNPPYSQISNWIEKAYHEAGRPRYIDFPQKEPVITKVVCLIPARVDTRWWWNYCIAGEIRFLKGRLKFVGAESSAPFPSAVVILDQPLPITTRLWTKATPISATWWDWKADY